MTTLTYGLKAPDDGDLSQNASGWFAALRANFVAIDAHTHNGVNSPLIAFANVSPLTTKGDLIGFSTVNARIPIGSDTQVLTADSSQTLGLKWAAAATAPDQSYELSNVAFACSVGSSALTIALKTKSATDPSSGDSVKIGFRSSTAATGTYAQRTVTSALSLVVSSGSTLGHADATNHYIYVYAIDNAGTVELAVSSVLYDQGTRQTTIAEGGAGAADSIRGLYSATLRTNVAVRLIARLKSNQTTAGTWAAVPTEISLVGPWIQEKPTALYETNTGTTISNNAATTAQFLCEDLVFDSHNAFSIVTNIYTVPMAGKYVVRASAALANASSWDNNDTFKLQLFKGGSLNRTFGGLVSSGTSTVTSGQMVSGSTLVSCVAGDTLEVRIFQDSGGNKALNTTAAENWVAYEWIGP